MDLLSVFPGIQEASRLATSQLSTPRRTIAVTIDPAATAASSRRRLRPTRLGGAAERIRESYRDVTAGSRTTGRRGASSRRRRSHPTPRGGMAARADVRHRAAATRGHAAACRGATTTVAARDTAGRPRDARSTPGATNTRTSAATTTGDAAGSSGRTYRPTVVVAAARPYTTGGERLLLVAARFDAATAWIRPSDTRLLADIAQAAGSVSSRRHRRYRLTGSPATPAPFAAHRGRRCSMQWRPRPPQPRSSSHPSWARSQRLPTSDQQPPGSPLSRRRPTSRCRSDGRPGPSAPRVRLPDLCSACLTTSRRLLVSRGSGRPRNPVLGAARAGLEHQLHSRPRVVESPSAAVTREDACRLRVPHLRRSPQLFAGVDGRKGTCST